MKRQTILLAALTVTLSLNAVTTLAADNRSVTKNKSNVEEFFFDVGSIGGVTTSEANDIYLVTKVNSVSKSKKSLNDVSQKKEETNPSPTVEVTTEVEGSGDYYAVDDTVINEAHQKQLAEEAARLREEKLASISWLSEYGVDTTQLSDARIDVLNEAKKWIGSWYVWGGTQPPQGSDWTYGNGGGGFDCSGYTGYVLRNALGIELPRTTYYQIGSSYFTRVPISEAMPGDIIFNSSISHTGFFLKDNGDSILLLHSPETGRRVQISTYSRPSYVYRYVQ